jgi:dynein heavy chain
VQKYSLEFDAIYKRKNYSTPKNYLDFINNYMNFLAKKRNDMDFQVRRLEGGLATLATASEAVAELQEVLAAKNAVIAEKKVEVEKIIFDISGKTEIANEKQKIATKMKAELSV